MLASLRPHDLLWPSSQEGLRSGSGALPDWCNSTWPVVMRRAPTDGPWLPVGIRGENRSLRHPAFLHKDFIARCSTPESLITAWQVHPELLAFNSVAMLKYLSQILKDLNLPWGPTGSSGFALATGYSVLRHESDLDLVVRATKPFTIQQIKILNSLQDKSLDAECCRIDLQIDTGHGAFAFKEWQNTNKNVLLKTNSGPVLTEYPWGIV